MRRQAGGFGNDMSIYTRGEEDGQNGFSINERSMEIADSGYLGWSMGCIVDRVRGGEARNCMHRISSHDI
jgi:hypothetical protein